MHRISICLLLLDNEKKEKLPSRNWQRKEQAIRGSGGRGRHTGGETATESCLNVINEITAGKAVSL